MMASRRKEITVHGSRVVEGDEARDLRLAASQSIRNAGLVRRLERVEIRHRHTPDRLSVEKAMLAVEEAFVNALWVLQRVEGGDGPIGYVSGSVDYMADHVDLYGQAVAGTLRTPAPRPAIPSAKEITLAEHVQTWVTLLDPMPARVLTIGAMSKRGDAGRRVNWIRVKRRLPELGGYSTRALQGFYTGALREIVAELTTRRPGNN